LVEKIGQNYDAIILAVSHKEFLNIDFKSVMRNANSVIFDTKSFLDRDLVDARL
jgi:UDP-N-acetyl-D-galactosamine dehydrogenase